jgi:AcrR family transcriptional regulator
MADVRPRPTRRQESAEFTRKVILDAARELFTSQGYTATTVNDIAARARVAIATVYTSIGGKPTLLRALIEISVNDPDKARTLEAIRASSDPDEILRLVAAGTRHSHQRDHQTIRLMLTAASVAPSAAEVARDGAAAYRRALRVAAVRLDELSALRPGLTVERATDVLWFFFGLQGWAQLVDDSGWSYDEAERWLVARAVEALLRR